MANSPNIAVIGAGVVGCSVAYYLSKAGCKVTVFEKEAIGSGASAHATGSIHLLGMEFSEGPSFELALAGYREFAGLVPALENDTGINLLYQRLPSLRLALDKDEETLIKELMTWQEKHVPMHWIDGNEVRKIDPRFSNDVLGAVFEDESTQLDSYRLTLALGQGAERHGADLRLREVRGLVTRGERVTGVLTSDGKQEYDWVIIAAGMWSAIFGEWLGFDIPVRPLKGERLLLRYRAQPLPVLVSSPKRGHMISRLDGLMSVGSTGGRDYDRDQLFLGEEFDRQPTESARIELMKRAIDVLPDLENAELVQQLAGSRPLSPDRMPIIGPVPGWKGILLATGHTTKGIHLGPVTGHIISDYILNGKTDIVSDMSGFLPDRFDSLDEPDFLESGEKVDE
ncbi:FAD-dependent oxidoreductase [SAR202 cluster bacterium AD-804-J14_MRT_500m]|nr:FAD-dependent oxidoreductase [SAR202 cluster bacterium AD-804-J14_MRT_500m]